MAFLTNTLSAAGPILGLIGTYLFILSYQKQHQIKHTLTKGKVTEGTVVEIRENPGSLFGKEQAEGYAPVVDFQVGSSTHRHYSGTYKLPARYKVGQKVKIYYYFYRSISEFALEDDEPGSLPGTLFRWGLAFCAIGYPLLLIRLGRLF